MVSDHRADTSAYLQGGTFQGEQLLPKEWIDYSLTPVSNSDSPGGGKYGAGWWLGGYPSALLPSPHQAAFQQS